MSAPTLEFFIRRGDESDGSDDSVETIFTVLYDGPLCTPEDTISEEVSYVAVEEPDVVQPTLEPVIGDQVIDEPTMSAGARDSNMSWDRSAPASEETLMGESPQDVSMPTPPIHSATLPVGPHCPEYFNIVYDYAGNPARQRYFFFFFLTLTYDLKRNS